MQKARRTIRRRRREGKTDYKARMAFLKSDKNRIVVRKSNRYIIGQVIASDLAQDKVLVSVTSKDLLDKGWPQELKGSLKSMPAAYLTGYLLGKKTKETSGALFDIGLQRNIHKSRLYAFLRGLIDAGVEIPHKEEILPNEERIKSHEKAGKIVEKIKGDIK